MLEYAYDDAAESGLYQKVTKTVVGDAAAPSIVTTQYTDKCGNVVKTGQLLNGTEHLNTFAYDYVGNKTLELSAADAARNLPFTAKYEYNENGQVVKAYNAAGQFTTSTYNALGQLIQTTDYAGTPTAYTYDALGRLLSQTVTIEDDITAVSKYEYDGCGNIIREWKPVQAVGAAAKWSKTEYTYNSRKKLISAKQYDGSTLASETAYTYDGVGNMLSMNAGGSTTSYTYDRFGNVLSTTDALGQTETNAYSVLGRLESKTDRNGIATSYTYDALVVLAIGTAVAVFAILQKMIPDAYAASVDLLHEFGVLVKAAKESLEEYIKRKAAEYVASQAQTAAGIPDPDDNRKNWKKVASEYLEQKLNKQGTDAHKVKQEYLGKNDNISQCDIYVNKDTGQLGLFEKSTGNFVGYLDYFIK